MSSTNAKRSGSQGRFKKAGRTPSLCVLLVEDHADTRLALEKLLKGLGHRPEVAQNMAEALLLGCAEREKIDLLLSDIGLPDGDGWELLSQLRERGCCPKRAIAFSGWGSRVDLLKSKAAGFEAHLTKPLSLAVLEAALLEKRQGALDNNPLLGAVSTISQKAKTIRGQKWIRGPTLRPR